MGSPIEAIVNVFRNISQSNTDKTALSDVSDFEDLDLSKTDLSSDAINALKEGKKLADEDQREFEKVVAKKSQPVIAPQQRTRVKTPSRSDIVRGEDVEKDDEEQEEENERTIGPKH